MSAGVAKRSIAMAIVGLLFGGLGGWIGQTQGLLSGIVVTAVIGIGGPILLLGIVGMIGKAPEGPIDVIVEGLYEGCWLIIAMLTALLIVGAVLGATLGLIVGALVEAGILALLSATYILSKIKKTKQHRDGMSGAELNCPRCKMQGATLLNVMTTEDPSERVGLYQCENCGCTWTQRGPHGSSLVVSPTLAKTRFASIHALEGAIAKDAAPGKASVLTLEECIEELQERGFDLGPRSDRLFYNPQIPGLRFCIGKRVIRLESKRATKWGRPWQLVRSFSIARETHLVVEAADILLRTEAKGEE